MPSLWSAAGEEPASTVRGSATLGTRASVIALALLPLATLQAEPGNQDGRKQEGNHRGGDGRTLTEIAAADGALIAERGHQVRGIYRATAGEYPDELEVGEGEEHRECHHHCDDRGEQRVGDVAEHLQAAGAVDGRGLVQRGRHRLKAGEQRDRNERHAAPRSEEHTSELQSLR